LLGVVSAREWLLIAVAAALGLVVGVLEGGGGEHW
jgi:hypothetical protein